LGLSGRGRNGHAKRYQAQFPLSIWPFKRHAKRTSLQIAEGDRRRGGYINAYTSQKRSDGVLRARAGNDVSLGPGWIADILRNPVLE